MPHLKDSTVPLEIRFWNRVNKDGPIHPTHGRCWVWTGPVMPNGYGQINVKGKNCYVHRCSFLIHFGSIPDGSVICHHCDNKRCVNPSHLFSGSQKDNRLDSVKKDRHSRGTRQWIAKLTDDLVREIRRRYKSKSRKDGATALARELGLSHQSVWDAAVGRTWKHVK